MSQFTESDRKWIAWLIVVALTVVGTIIGVQFPQLPPVPVAMDLEAQSVGGQPSNFSSLKIAVPTVQTTATPGVVIDSSGVANSLEIRSAATPVFSVAKGGGLDLNSALDVDTTSAISLDADAASNFNVAGAGIDLTIESEAGRLILKGDEAAANGITIDANDAVTTGLDIDVGSVSGMRVDGGLLDVGGGTCGVADGDNDVCIAAVLEVDGELEADGAIDADNGLTVDGAVTNIGGGTPEVATGDNDLFVTADLEVDGELECDGTVDIDGVMNLVVGTEHIGAMTIASTSITYTAAAGGSGTVATVGASEIWIVHAVLVNVTTNFDATGDDATLTVGDGNDTDGFITLADAELQTADTEATGFAAGWQGLVPATQGAYIDSAAGTNYFIYDGTDTIDWAVDEGDGETLSAGAATIYVIYTRIQ